MLLLELLVILLQGGAEVVVQERSRGGAECRGAEVQRSKDGGDAYVLNMCRGAEVPQQR